MKTVIVMSLLMFCSIGAMAEVKTHELYDRCRNEKDAVEQIGCLAYLRGYADGMLFVADPAGTNDDAHLDISGSAEALRRSFVNYVDSHIALMDDPIPGHVLVQAWKYDGLAKAIKGGTNSK